MRTINYIVLHCTAGNQKSTTIEGLLRHWKSLGWKNPGYHYLIFPDGSLHNIHDVSKIANGVAGFNSNSIHVSYVGGVDSKLKPLDNRTEAQKETLKKIVLQLKETYPKAKILGHKDFPNVKKACPSFDVSKWLKQENI
jgi:N-acetylmuramoyl-L-alanine amidase